MGKVKMKKQLISVITAVCLGITGLGAGMYGTIASHAEQEQPVRIMAIGDSITDGYIDGNNGYRKYFCYEMQQKAFTNFDMVGCNNNWTNEATYLYQGHTITYDPAHAGFSGYTIESYPGRNGIYETIFNMEYSSEYGSGNMIAAYDPDIIMLQIGTNDILDAKSEGIQERLEKLVDAVLEEMQGTEDMLFLASIPDIDVSVRYDWLSAYYTMYQLDYYTDPEGLTAKVQECLDEYNEIVKQVVAEKQAEGKRIRFADIHSTVDMKTGLYDGVHPNENGYACMGAYWSEQVYAYLSEIGVVGDGEDTGKTSEVSSFTETTSTENNETATTIITDASVTTAIVPDDTATSTTETVTNFTTTSGLTGTVTTTKEDITTQKGDINGDGEFTVVDIVLLCRFLLGEYNESWHIEQCADMNDDGKINGIDLAMQRQMIVMLWNGE